jgi:3-(3-hydroxy-phenyl)propionate hydroxylase
MTIEYDVAIAGLGPVGAVMTSLLAQHGLRVIAIEKDPEVFPLPRAAHIDHTGLRTLQEIGCLDEVLPAMIRNKRLDLLNADREVLARIPADQESVSGLPTSVYFYQPDFDAVLRRRAAGHAGTTIMLGNTLRGIAGIPGSEDLSLQVVDSTGKETAIRAKWLVGCDGARSFVREASGINLESLDFDEKWLVIDLTVKPEATGLPVDHVIEVCDPARPYLSTPISSGRQRFEFMLLPGEESDAMLNGEVIARLLAPWLHESLYEVQRAAVYTFHGVVADKWRKGRVLIAGDAAHQTPPFLGQGMCAGFRDAVNLAWKLARVIAGKSSEALIDTYESERLAHAVKVIHAAIRIGKTICELDPVRAAERDRLLVANDRGVRKSLSFSLPGLERGPLVLDGGGSLFVQSRLDGTLTDDIIGSRFFVLARDEAALGNSAGWWRTEIGAHIALLRDFPGVGLARWFDQSASEVVVVRPDRYVLGTATSLDIITQAVAGVLTLNVEELAS